MKTRDKLLENRNVLVAISLDDLKEFALEVITLTLQKINQNSEPEPVWLSPKQVAKRFKIDPSTLWRWEKEGYIRADRFGRRVRFNEREVIRVENAEKGRRSDES